ncbi:MAG TPA: phosphatase PAP2 family protein [Rhizomicrobium sp.]|jgi:hypothetical protein|nr:phosphatase PAP2 family protein [Rhizomicrobium sp.]
MFSRLRFPLEWIALTFIALVDLIWAQQIDFRLLVDSGDAAAIATPLLLLIAAWVARAPRAALALEFFCLSLACAVVYGVMSYLALASAYGPLRDATLLAADRALGFDWLALYQWIVARPLLSGLLLTLYISVVAQALIASVVLGLRQQHRELTELFRVILVSSFITCMGAMLFPSLGPFKIFAIHGRGFFLVDMEHLLSHRDLIFSLSKLGGVVNFPSFHVVLALTYGYGFYRAGAFGRALTAMNILMIFSIPFMGGHYLVDVLAGTGVFALSLATVKVIGRLSPDNVFAKVTSPSLIADETRSWHRSIGTLAD